MDTTDTIDAAANSKRNNIAKWLMLNQLGGSSDLSGLVDTDPQNRMARALYEQGLADLPTNETAGGYVVPISPLSGLNKVAQALTGSYLLKKNADKQAAAAIKQAQGLSSIDFNSKDAPNQAAALGASMDDVISLAKTLHEKQGGGADSYLLGYDSKGNPFRFNKGTGTIGLTPDESGKPFEGGSALYSPDAVGGREKAKAANKGYVLEDREGHKGLYSGAEANPGFASPNVDTSKPGVYRLEEGSPEFNAVIENLKNPQNNPGNIRPPGKSEGFQSYSSPEQGLAAIDQNLQAYGEKGINTLAGVIGRWSPNTENDTPALIANAAKRLGIDPNQPIDLADPVQRHAISSAILMQENDIFKGGKGGRLQGQSPSEKAADTARATFPIDMQKEQLKNQMQTDAKKQQLIDEENVKRDQALKAQVPGRQQVTKVLGNLHGYYDQLAKSGGITDPDQSTFHNIIAGITSSAPGQVAGKFVGSKDQSTRNSIEQTRPLLMQAIMKATGMSAKQMDSNRELQLYLQTATDPTLDVAANRRALQTLESLFGLGGLEGSPAQQPKPTGGWTVTRVK